MHVEHFQERRCLIIIKSIRNIAERTRDLAPHTWIPTPFRNFRMVHVSANITYNKVYNNRQDAAIWPENTKTKLRDVASSQKACGGMGYR